MCLCDCVCVIQHRNWPLRSTILNAHGTNASPDGLCTRTHTNEAFPCWFCCNSSRVDRGRRDNVCRHAWAVFKKLRTHVPGTSFSSVLIWMGFAVARNKEACPSHPRVLESDRTPAFRLLLLDAAAAATAPRTAGWSCSVFYF